MRRNWWVAGAPVFVALALAFAFVQPYLITGLHPLQNQTVAADARAIARRRGSRKCPSRSRRCTSRPPRRTRRRSGSDRSRRVILWDTLLDGRFSRREVRTVVAHEFGHVKRNHVLKGVGWFGLAIVPTAFLIALATRRRGGMYAPEAVPVAIFVLIAVQVATIPLQNVVSRHVEAEADWIALQTTRDPAAAGGAFHRARRCASLTQPRPPAWAYVLFDNHPTIIQRIAMTGPGSSADERRRAALGCDLST